jgi:putative tricarboxylic transport membrane protein
VSALTVSAAARVEEHAPGRTGDRVAALLLLVLAVAMYVGTMNFPDPGQQGDPGTAAFPRIIAGVLAALAFVVLLRPEQVDFLPHRSGLVRVGGVAGLSVLYGFSLEGLGFVLTTAAFLAISLVLMGVRRGVALVLTVVILPVALYLLFAVGLDVFLPRGIIERTLLP